MIENLIRFAIYVCSAFVSCKYFNGHWIVGPVFGLAVVGWDSKNFRDLSAAKHLAFLAASSLIYALVFQISTQNWNHGSDLYDSLFGSLPIAVITGSILLPAAHKALLKAETKKSVRTIPLLILSYYVIAFFSLGNDTWKWGLQINFLLLSISAWQGIYLYSFFT